MPPRMRKSSDAEHVTQTYQRIYAVVRKIPRGTVATYGQVAELAGIPCGHRVAAAALKALALVSAPGVPWQRVVGKRAPALAQINIRDPVGGAMQRKLLESEGVGFTHNGAIRLREHGWLPL